jgi:hypothetical protein
VRTAVDDVHPGDGHYEFLDTDLLAFITGLRVQLVFSLECCLFRVSDLHKILTPTPSRLSQR